MEDTKDRRIKAALYTAVLNKLSGELSELEAREVLLTNAPAYITSKDHDHANHIEELKNIIIKKVELQDTLNLIENENKIHNWIDFKNFVRKIFVNYYEG